MVFRPRLDIRDMPLVPHSESGRKGVFWIQDDLLVTSDPCSALDDWYNSINISDFDSPRNAALEGCVNDASVLEVFSNRQLALGMQQSHSRAGAGATRAAIKTPGRHNHSVLGDLPNGILVKRLCEFQNRDALDFWVLRMMRRLHKLRALARLDGHPDRCRIHDSVPHPAPDNVGGDGPDPRDVNLQIEPVHEGGHIFKSHGFAFTTLALRSHADQTSRRI
ncbi:proline racemase [Colletotrichum scovillei]|uniref:Proline racemase n=1 Tax=Colletotrichum scovillei TaxID=1209932 RepID=A0A9P7UJX9_9PEZI|nr:proline racemase [Colletotrichum scovillei]KAG7075743.1 proline racemase [Colletotrichum scovillei]KAG7082866.1 proline racemase [Colletotrichum scovillei]